MQIHQTSYEVRPYCDMNRAYTLFIWLGIWSHYLLELDCRALYEDTTLPHSHTSDLKCLLNFLGLPILHALNSIFRDSTVGQAEQNQSQLKLQKSIYSGSVKLTSFLALNRLIVNQARPSEIKKKLSRGEICVANLKAPLRMVRVWTGF